MPVRDGEVLFAQLTSPLEPADDGRVTTPSARKLLMHSREIER